MRNYAVELENRVRFIREVLAETGAEGIVYGNSGGKDSALVGILCKKACDNTLGIMLPCGSKRNYGEDKADAQQVAQQFDISLRTVDLTESKQILMAGLSQAVSLSESAAANIAPRLRMTTLYAIAASENRLVAGTGNRSEAHMGYFTKWGDGAYDFNPIADLTVTEIFDFLRFLKAPSSIIDKAPSAGLFEGQTDETEMGISYRSIDDFLLNGIAEESAREVIDSFHNSSAHKRQLPIVYKNSAAEEPGDKKP